MSRLFLLLVCSFLFFALACGDDDDLSPITNIGRQDGWFVQAVDSDFASRFDAQLAALPDAFFADNDTTRTGVEAIYADRIERLTNVEACDRDDILFFFPDGEILTAKGDVTCDAPGDPSVTDYFDRLFYAASADGSTFRLRTRDNAEIGRFDVSVLNGDRFVFARDVTVTDTLIGDFTYALEYDLVAR